MVHDSLSHYSYIRVGDIEHQMRLFIEWFSIDEIFMDEPHPFFLGERCNRRSHISRYSHSLQDDCLIEFQVEGDPVIEHPLHIVVKTGCATTGREDG